MRRSRSRGTRIFILIDRLIANENFSFLNPTIFVHLLSSIKEWTIDKCCEKKKVVQFRNKVSQYNSP